MWDDSLLVSLHEFGLRNGGDVVVSAGVGVDAGVGMGLGAEPSPASKSAEKKKSKGGAGGGSRRRQVAAEAVISGPRINAEDVVASIKPPWRIINTKGQQIFRGFMKIVCPHGHMHVYAVDSAGMWCKTCRFLERAPVGVLSALEEFGSAVVCGEELSAAMVQVGRQRRTAVSFCSFSGDKFLHIDGPKYASWPTGKRADNFYADTRKKQPPRPLVAARTIGRPIILFT